MEFRRERVLERERISPFKIQKNGQFIFLDEFLNNLDFFNWQLIEKNRINFNVLGIKIALLTIRNIMSKKEVKLEKQTEKKVAMFC